MNKKLLLVLGIILILAITASGINYKDALVKSINFFDANKCGPNVTSSNTVAWRSACHTTDGSEVGRDLSGGFHDAGDHVKFGLPQAFAAATIGYALYEFKSAFDSAGATSKALEICKYFTDYFLKCHPDSNTFYYQIGDGSSDHGYWGKPETQTTSRPVMSPATLSNSCSDITGHTAAALALMYLNYKNTNSTYATQCLNAAKSIYNIALQNNTRGQDGGDFYNTSSHYDDLSWGAIWLYRATGTSSYLTPVYGWQGIPGDYGGTNWQFGWAANWDNVTPFVMVEMAEIALDHKQEYIDAVAWNLNWYKNSAPRTSNSTLWTVYLQNWGALRFNAAQAGTAYAAYKGIGNSTLNALSTSMLDYICGTNPRNSSYITGWGNNPPLHPHHRANEPNYFQQSGPLNGLIGGLVGGPSQSDGFNDATMEYAYTEVTIDYNAALVFGLAGKIWLDAGGQPGATTTSGATATRTATPAPTSGATPTRTATTAGGGSGTILRQYWNNINGLNVTDLTNNSAYPNSPSGSGTLNLFEAPSGTGDSYGCRIIGYIHPAVSGNYTFWIAADDAAELWLSTSDSASNRQLICNVTSWTNSREWTKYTSQVSATKYLNAGSKYYIEAIMKEGTGGDNLAVAWQPPNGSQEVIPGSFLSPYVVGTTGPTATPAATATWTATPAITATRTAATTATRTAATTATRTATAAATPTPASTQTPTPAPTPTGGATGCTCAVGCGSQTVVAPNFVKDGAGEFCWETTSLGANYFTSYNCDIVNINGTPFLNFYVTPGSYPAPINGKYYIYYKASVDWAHFEMMN